MKFVKTLFENKDVIAVLNNRQMRLRPDFLFSHQIDKGQDKNCL